QPRRGGGLGGEDRICLDRPVDREIGIVPGDSSLRGRIVERRALVEQLRVVFEGAETVRESWWDPEHAAVVLGQLGADPAAEGRRSAPHVGRDVEQPAATAPN